MVSFLLSYTSIAQTKIEGVVKDWETELPIANVNIRNIFTSEIVRTDSQGKFSITIEKGQLIECTHVSYDILRVRIQSETAPKFYNLVMRLNSKKLNEIFVLNKDNVNYKKDSIQRAKDYKLILDKPKKEDTDWRILAVEYLSKKRRQEFAFVKNFNKFEQEKYIDYKFDPKKLERWTGLRDKDLLEFMRQYRPSYEYLRSTNDYDYYVYLKRCLKEFCPNCVFRIN